MWLSCITYDLVALRAMPADQANEILVSIKNKKRDLAGLDNDGESIPEFPAPASFEDPDPNLTSLTIKRSWVTQAKAQEFSDFADAAAEFITASVEEQV